MTRTNLSTLVLLPMLGLGCGLEPIEDDGSEDQVPAAVQAAFDETCATAGCHANSGALSPKLGPGASEALLTTLASTGDPYVVIGELESSYIARKILGTDINGGQMPLSVQSPNDAVNVAIILGWIAGAEFSDEAGDGDGDTTDTGDTTTGDGDPDCYAEKPIPAMPSFETDVWPTIEARCSIGGCHDGMTTAPAMPDAPTAFTNLVGVASSSGMNYVTADAPEDSYVWHKLSGTQALVGGFGGPMPQIGEMCTVEMQTIYAWILSGAAP